MSRIPIKRSGNAMRTGLNMSRSASRGLAVVGATVFAVSLSVGGAGSAVAAPTAGPFETMQDFKGGWLTSLRGFQDADAISWQHRMIVRKVKGSAAVAWEQWRDCADYAVQCKAGKATGDGWTSPSRVLLVMDPEGVVHGVGATGTIMLTPDGDGLSAMMMSSGQRDTATATPTTSGQSSIAFRTLPPSYQTLGGSSYAASGSVVSCPSDTSIQN